MSQPRPWLKWIGLGCGGLVLLVAVFVVVLVFAVRSLTSGPEEVARDFLAAAAAGDYARAHDHFAAPLKEKQPLDAFRASVEATPSLFDVADTTFSDRSVDMTGAKLSGTARLAAGTTVPVSFTFAREHDTWKILAYRLGSTD